MTTRQGEKLSEEAAQGLSQNIPFPPSRRILKKFVQQGRSERRTEAYPCGTLRV